MRPPVLFHSPSGSVRIIVVELATLPAPAILARKGEPVWRRRQFGFLISLWSRFADGKGCRQHITFTQLRLGVASELDVTDALKAKSSAQGYQSLGEDGAEPRPANPPGRFVSGCFRRAVLQVVRACVRPVEALEMATHPDTMYRIVDPEPSRSLMRRLVLSFGVTFRSSVTASSRRRTTSLVCLGRPRSWS